MWMICGIISILFCVSAWIMAAGKNPKASRAAACSLAFVSLTLLMAYKLVSDWVVKEDWSSLLDVVPSMFLILTGYVIVTLLADIILIVAKS